MGSRPTSGTSSRSSTSSPADSGDPRGHTALHVLRGAVTSVMGPRRFSFAQEGVLRFNAERPLTPQEVARVEEAANGKVGEDAEVVEFSMEREEAEGHFGTGIYDLVQEEKGQELLKIARIADWEESACPREHVESTGSLGAIKVDGEEFHEATGEVELRYHLL